MILYFLNECSLLSGTIFGATKKARSDNGIHTPEFISTEQYTPSTN